MTDDLGLWLREQRQACGWSAAEMARKLRQAAKASGDSTIPGSAILASYIRRWEQGAISPAERYRLHYCKALGIRPSEFGPETISGRPADPDGATPASVSSRTGCDPSDPSVEAGGYRDVESPYRDTDHCCWPTGAMRIPAIADESQEFGEWADTSNVGNATLDHYAAQVRQLARDYEHAAPYPLLLEARRLRDRIFGRLRGHQRPSQTRELYLLAAQVCGLLAWMSGDMNFYRAADSHAWTAWVCAEQASHDGARVWVRVTQSKLAYWDGRYLESAQLAEDGLRYGSGGSGQVMLRLFQARALARLGDDQEAATVLAVAGAGLEQASPEDVGGLWGVNEARYHSLAGSAHLWRHDPGEVLTESRLALTLFEAIDPDKRNFGAVAHTHVDQAQAHLLFGDLDSAGAALRPVLALPSECRYEPITQELGRVRQALAVPAFRDAAMARQLHEEMETYCRESIVNDVSG